MADAKEKEQQKFLELRDIHKRPDGSTDITTIYNFFKESGDYVYVSDPTLRKWDKQARAADGFDADGYINDNLEQILKSLIKSIKDKGAPKNIETALKLAGMLIERREDRVKVEFTPTDRIAIATEFREALIGEFRDTGVCSICGFSKALYDQPRLDKGREQEQEGEMATLALPA